MGCGELARNQASTGRDRARWTYETSSDSELTVCQRNARRISAISLTPSALIRCPYTDCPFSSTYVIKKLLKCFCTARRTWSMAIHSPIDPVLTSPRCSKLISYSQHCITARPCWRSLARPLRRPRSASRHTAFFAASCQCPTTAHRQTSPPGHHSARIPACGLYALRVGPAGLGLACPSLAQPQVGPHGSSLVPRSDRRCRLASTCRARRCSRSRCKSDPRVILAIANALDQVVVEQVLSLVFLLIVPGISLSPTLALFVLVVIAHNILIPQLREGDGRR